MVCQRIKNLRVRAFGTVLFEKNRQRKQEDFGNTGEVLSSEKVKRSSATGRALSRAKSLNSRRQSAHSNHFAESLRNAVLSSAGRLDWLIGMAVQRDDVARRCGVLVSGAWPKRQRRAGRKINGLGWVYQNCPVVETPRHKTGGRFGLDEITLCAAIGGKAQ